MKESYQHWQKQAELKDLKIIFDKPKKPLSQTLADAEILGRAVSRLIDNAILYTPQEAKKKEIIVKADILKKDNKDLIEIAVQDFGIGFEKEERDNFFKLFYRYLARCCRTLIVKERIFSIIKIW